MQVINPTKKNSYFFTKANLWHLFLLVSMPTHCWAIILSFRDVQMIAERTNMFDAFAFVAYILIFALAESCMVFLFALAAFPFLPKRWSTIQHTLALGLLSYISASWIILRQLNFWNDNRYGILVRFVDGSTHPLKYGALIIIVIGVSVFLSIFLPILCTVSYTHLTLPTN